MKQSSSSLESLPRSSPDVIAHGVFLGLSLMVMIASILLQNSDSAGDSRLQWGGNGQGFALPPLCIAKRLTGYDCPGCGLSRSFVALAHGEWSESLAFNPVGWYWFGFIAGQIPYRAVQIYRIRRGRREFDLSTWGTAIIVVGMVALFIQWLARHVFL